MSNQASYLEVIKNSGFRYLWINQILVQIAYNTLNFALIIWVYKLVGNNTSLAILMLSIYSPGIIFGIFSGIFADMVDKKKIILMIDLLLAVSFLVFIFTKSIYPLLLINAFMVNSLSAFFMPSESSAIPALVSNRQLFMANSLFSLTLYASIMVGFSIGGPLLNHLGMDSILVVGIAMFLVAFLFAQGLPPIPPAKGNHLNGSLLTPKTFQWLINLTISETKSTLHFIRGQLTIMAAILLLASVQGIVGVMAVMMPSYMEQILKIHATDASYIMMLPLGLGMVTGAFILGKYFQNRPRRSLVLPAIILAGSIFILVGVVPSIADYLKAPELPARVYRLRYFMRVPSLSTWFAFGAFLLGLCTVSIIIPCQTVIQEYTEPKNRGKTFAVLSVLMTAFSAIPIALSGVLSDLFGVTPIFLGAGVVILIVGLIATHPNLLFNEKNLPFRVREFLGLGHWQR